MKELLKQFVEAADKRVDEKGLALDAALIILFPLIDKAVKGTEVQWDDAVWAATKEKVLKVLE